MQGRSHKFLSKGFKFSKRAAHDFSPRNDRSTKQQQSAGKGIPLIYSSDLWKSHESRPGFRSPGPTWPAITSLSSRPTVCVMGCSDEDQHPPHSAERIDFKLAVQVLTWSSTVVPRWRTLPVGGSQPTTSPSFSAIFITGRPPYASVNHRRQSFSCRRRTCVERSAAARNCIRILSV